MFNRNSLNIRRLNSAPLPQTVALNAVAVTMVGLLLNLVNDVTIAVTQYSNQVAVWVKVLLVKVVKPPGQHSPLDKYNQADLIQQQSSDTFNENISRAIKSY
jgi:hypothetical protein